MRQNNIRRVFVTVFLRILECVFFFVVVVVVVVVEKITREPRAKRARVHNNYWRAYNIALYYGKTCERIEKLKTILKCEPFCSSVFVALTFRYEIQKKKTLCTPAETCLRGLIVSV